MNSRGARETADRAQKATADEAETSFADHKRDVPQVDRRTGLPNKAGVREGLCCRSHAFDDRAAIRSGDIEVIGTRPPVERAARPAREDEQVHVRCPAGDPTCRTVGSISTRIQAGLTSKRPEFAAFRKSSARILLP